MKFKKAFAVTICTVGTLVTGLSTANAATCAEILQSIGRLYEPDAARLPVSKPDTKNAPSDCTQDQLIHLRVDPNTAKTVKPALNRDQLVGSYVSDDVLDIFNGKFLPIYEVLEIAPGDAPDEVVITQRAWRAYDAVEQAITGYSSVIDTKIDVARTGRMPVLGRLEAKLLRAGELHPTKIRSFDVMLSTHRGADLDVKRNLMSLYHLERPLQVFANERAVLFEYDDRAYKPYKRMRTFTKRSPEALLAALYIAYAGEISMSRFPCLAHAWDQEPAAFRSAMQGVVKQEFLAFLQTAIDLDKKRTSLMAKLQVRGRSSDEIEKLKSEMQAVLIRFSDMQKEKEWNVLIDAARSNTPFGCPDIR